MLFSAAEKWGIDLQQSFLVGDRSRDIQAGHAAGVTSILVGPEADTSRGSTLVASGLLEAAHLISAQNATRKAPEKVVFKPRPHAGCRLHQEG